MEEVFSSEQIRWFRFRRSGLARGQTDFATPEAAAAALVGVQAQILSASALAFWNRTASGATTYEEFSRRLHDERTIIKLWGQRHTLHIYATEDWPVVQAAFAERLTWWEREAKLTGGGPLLAEYHRAVERVGRMLEERGTMGRRELRALETSLPQPLLSPWGGVFSALVRHGFACHARWDEGEARYAHRSHWLPDLAWAPPDPAEANRRLARRYFRAYGPSTIQDFTYWRGIGGKTTRAAFQALEPDLEGIRTTDGQAMFVLRDDLLDLGQEPPARERWEIRLLGRFDPLLLAHRSKDWIVPARHYARVWRPAGHIEGVVLVHGQAAATWRYERVGVTRLDVQVFPFKRLSARVLAAVRREVRGVARFFGLRPGGVAVQETGP